MSIIRATRQKGGSTFPLTSHVSLFFIRSSFGTHLATKPRATEELQTSLLSNQKESRRNNNSISWKNQKYQERIFNHTGKFLLAVFFMLLDRIFRNPQTTGNFRNLQSFQCKLHYETALGRKLFNRCHQIGIDIFL